MIVRKRTDADGDCFAKCSTRELHNGCIALRHVDHEDCGTYMCPFYKPFECEDWVRIEDGDEIHLLAPEEVRLR